MSLKIIPNADMVETLQQLTANGDTRENAAVAMGISPRTLGTWLTGEEYPEIREAWLRAKEVWALDVADDIMRVASAPLHEDPKFANAEVARRRLIVDTSKYLAGKLLPKIYGEVSMKIEHSGTVALSPLAQLRQLTPSGPIVDVSDTVGNEPT
jgi:hypothetical protein